MRPFLGASSSAFPVRGYYTIKYNHVPVVGIASGLMNAVLARHENLLHIYFWWYVMLRITRVDMLLLTLAEVQPMAKAA